MRRTDAQAMSSGQREVSLDNSYLMLSHRVVLLDHWTTPAVSLDIHTLDVDRRRTFQLFKADSGAAVNMDWVVRNFGHTKDKDRLSPVCGQDGALGEGRSDAAFFKSISKAGSNSHKFVMGLQSCFVYRDEDSDFGVRESSMFVRLYNFDVMKRQRLPRHSPVGVPSWSSTKIGTERWLFIFKMCDLCTWLRGVSLAISRVHVRLPLQYCTVPEVSHLVHRTPDSVCSYHAANQEERSNP